MNPAGFRLRAAVSATAAALVIAAAGAASALPVLADPERYRVELFADFAPLGGALKAFDLLMLGPGSGFAPGLYASSGPAGDARSDRIVHVGRDGRPTVFADGFVSNEALAFSQDGYPPGLLVSIPRDRRIDLVAPDGSRSVFAAGFPGPFGPTGMAFAGGRLHAAGGGATIFDVSPIGDLTLGIDVTEDDPPWYCAIPNLLCAIKGLVMSSSDDEDEGEGFGPGLIASTYTVALDDGVARPGAGLVFLLPEAGGLPELLFSGLDGIELPEFGPGGDFGDDLWLPVAGGEENGDGGLYILSPDGGLQRFLSGIDAASVVFDEAGLFGGGLFVTDLNDSGGAGRVWRISRVVVPAPPSLPLLAAALALAAYGGGRASRRAAARRPRL